MIASDTKVASAAKRLESPVCDVAHMAEVTSTCLESVFSGSFEGETMTLHRDHVDQAMFCVYHLSSMMQKLKAAYYLALDGKETADA